LRSTPGSARGRRLGLDVGASLWRARATAPEKTTTASWNGWWQPTTATQHSRRGASSAQRPPSSSASQRRQLTVDGEPHRMTAGHRKRSHPFITRLQSARYVHRKISRTSVHVHRYVQDFFRNARFPSMSELNSRYAHVGQLDWHTL